MAEEISVLIEKINREGIIAAEEKAKDIETAAKQRAAEIIAQATREAEEMLTAAENRIHREEEIGKSLLAQAGRDLLLSLRSEIIAMLERIVVSDIRQTLTPEALHMLLSEVIRTYSTGEQSDITVLLQNDDLKTLEEHFLHELRKETENKIILKPSEEISGGFTISFDSQKSCYDFTDQALAEYIGTYLKPKLNQILKETIKE